MTDERVLIAVDAFLARTSVHVQTASREFTGRIWEIGRSPYDDAIRARVVDSQGRVHYFRVDARDAQVTSV